MISEQQPSDGAIDTPNDADASKGFGPLNQLTSDTRTSLILRFPFDSDRLEGTQRQAIAEFAKSWPALQREGKSIVVTGYTDDIGPQGYNDSLAMARAEAVATALRDMGVPARVEARGKCDYIDTNETPQGRAANRRAEITLSTQHKEHVQ